MLLAWWWEEPGVKIYSESGTLADSMEGKDRVRERWVTDRL